MTPPEKDLNKQDNLPENDNKPNSSVHDVSEETGKDLNKPRTDTVSADVNKDLSAEKTPAEENRDISREYYMTVIGVQQEANKEVRDFIDAGLDTQPANVSDVKMSIQNITLDLLSGINELAGQWKNKIEKIYKDNSLTLEQKIKDLNDLQAFYIEKINSIREVISFYLLDAASNGPITEKILSMIQNEIRQVMELINTNTDLSDAFRFFVGMRSDKDPSFNYPERHEKTLLKYLKFQGNKPSHEATLCFTILKTMSFEQKNSFIKKYSDLYRGDPLKMDIFFDNASRYGSIGALEIEKYFEDNKIAPIKLEQYSKNYRNYTDAQDEKNNVGVSYNAENAFINATSWDNLLATGAEIWGAATVLSNIFVNFFYATKDADGIMDTLFKGIPSGLKGAVNPSSLLGASAAGLGYIYKHKDPDLLSEKSEKFNIQDNFYELMQDINWGSKEIGFFSMKEGDLDGEGILAFSEFLKSVYQTNEEPKDEEFSSEKFLSFLQNRDQGDYKNAELVKRFKNMQRENKYLNSDLLKFEKIFGILSIGGNNAKEIFKTEFEDAKKIREK